MSDTNVVYEVCHTCGVGKVAFDQESTIPQNATSDGDITFRKEHREHRLDLVPEAIFLSSYLRRGYTDVDRPDAQPITTSFGDNVVLGNEKEMPFGKPDAPKTALGKARAQRRAMLEGPPARDKVTPVVIPPKVIQMRPSWDATFLEIAATLAKRATCSRGAAGAVLVKDTRIISTGYNGAPAGLRHCNHADGGDMENGHCSRAEHAERNALLLARVDARGATMYLTYTPCLTCTRMMTTAGVKRIVYDVDYHPDERVDELCASAGIELVRVTSGAGDAVAQGSAK